MRIAMVAPLFETVPPTKYGGTERVVHYIVEELVRLGHDVTLYAAAGSKTSATLVECAPGCFRERGIKDFTEESESTYTVQLEAALSDLQKHDVVHVHQGTYPYQLAVLQANRKLPVVWTDHNAIHTDNKPAMFGDMAKLGIGLTGLSDSHKSTVPEANWLTVIHHGLPAQMLTPSGSTPTYLAFLGRISPEKGITTAVRISEAGRYRLKVAAKVDAANKVFYEDEVMPLFARSDVDFIGEISDQEKGPFLSGAVALIFPICWKEPFGLVMIEAMACGCPTIAFRMGSVPEIIEHGVTGFIVDTEEEAIEALRHIGRLDRRRIRQRFDERFTSTTMAQKYVDVYKQAVQQAKSAATAELPSQNIDLLQDTTPSIVPSASHTSLQRAEIMASFRRAPVLHDRMSESFMRRPAAARQVSANVM